MGGGRARGSLPGFSRAGGETRFRTACTANSSSGCVWRLYTIVETYGFHPKVPRCTAFSRVSYNVNMRCEYTGGL